MCAHRALAAVLIVADCPSAQFPSGIYERNNPYQLQVKVDSATEMKLESGQEYHWEVPLKISASSAPYERGIYGRLFHKVTATIDWPGWGGWWKAGKSLVAEQVCGKEASPAYSPLTRQPGRLSGLGATLDGRHQLCTHPRRLL